MQTKITVNAKEICLNLFEQLLKSDQFSASVHSIFSHVINLQTKFGLCSLLCKTSLRPYSVVLDNVSSFENWNIYKDTLFFIDASQINSKTTPLISLKNARQVNLKMPPMEAMDVNETIAGAAEKLNIIAESVYRSGCHEGLAPLLSSAAFPVKENPYSLFLRSRIAEFCRVMPGSDLEQIRYCTARIAGCGPGLTPSADDFICGFLPVFAALTFSERLLAAEKIKIVTSEAAAHTTSVSASFLHHCAQGLYSANVLEFVKTLFETHDTRKLRECCEKIIQSGSSSGADCLCGAYHALKAFYGRKIKPMLL